MKKGFGFPGINQWHCRVYNTRETSDTSAHETLGSQPTWQRHTRGGVYGGKGGFATSIQTYMHNVCLEFGPSTGSIMTCVCTLRMSTMFVFNLAHIACDKFVKHVLNFLSRPGCFRQRRKVLAHHSHVAFVLASASSFLLGLCQ